MVTVLYKDRVGYVISLVLTESDNSTPINLTNATVTIELKEKGSDTSKWTQTAIVTDAPNGLAKYTNVSGDFDTVGSYYTIVHITYVSGDRRDEVGPTFEIIENEENIVTVNEFRQFIDIPEENAKSDDTIKSYLEDAETRVDLDVSSVANTSNTSFIKQKKTLIKMRAAILYFMNTDENFIDPNKRNPKVELWKKEYNETLAKFNELLSSTATGESVVRRVKHSDYESGSGSYLEEG